MQRPMDKSQKAVSVFNKLATEYQARFMDVSMYHDTFDFFCETISTPNARILDIACGPGNITKYLLQKRPDFSLLGIDLAPKMLALAQANNPSAHFQLMDAREISKLTQQQDGIMCGFCLPYLSKAEALKLIQHASQLLHTGGLLYLSTMEDDYEKSGLKKGSTGDELFMHYHQADYLSEALLKNSLTLLKLDRKIIESADAPTVIDLILIAQKQA